MGMSELALVERIAARVRRRPGVALGIGDDAAVLDGTPATVATHDLLVDGVHFRRATTGWRDLGHKALAVSLSDVAAMGAEPVAALVGLALPPDAREADVDALYAGMEALAEGAGTTVAGGDVTTAPVLVLAVTALGRLPEGRAPVTRGGGRAGDLLCVTGALGTAGAGLLVLDDPSLASAHSETADLVAAQRRPWPRLREGARLAAAGAGAMMDLSDGLALDAGRLGRASGLTAVIALEHLPVTAATAAVARAAGHEPALLAATAGEDYELLVALAPWRLVAASRDLGARLTPVGRLEEGPPGVRLERSGHEVRPERLGWEHRVG